VRRGVLAVALVGLWGSSCGRAPNADEAARPEPAPRTTPAAAGAYGGRSPKGQATPGAPPTDGGAVGLEEAMGPGGTVGGGVPAGEALGGDALGGQAPDGLEEDLVFPGVGRSHRVLSQSLRDAAPTRFKPVGTSSLVYQMRLAGTVDAAFRPRSRRHPRGHLAEVAAYRVARALGMENVPPAVLRRVSRQELRTHLHPDFRDAWDSLEAETLWDPDGTVLGAAVFWIPEMSELGVDAEPGLAAWTRVLQQAGDGIPPGEDALHRDLARMVAFDYLIGNADRFSGSNAQGLVGPPRRVFVRDHNLAFPGSLRPERHRRIRGALLRTEKASRRFLEGLLELDGPRLRGILEVPAGEVGAAGSGLLLDEAQLDGVADRREALLSFFGALVDRHGAAAALPFP